MYELCRNEDTENNEGSDGPHRINHNGFLPVSAVRHLVRDESRSAMLRRLEFCIGQGLCIDSTLSEVNVFLTLVYAPYPFSSMTAHVL